MGTFETQNSVNRRLSFGVNTEGVVRVFICVCSCAVKEILEGTKEMNNYHRGGKEEPHKMGGGRRTFCCAFLHGGGGGAVESIILKKKKNNLF